MYGNLEFTIFLPVDPVVPTNSKGKKNSRYGLLHFVQCIVASNKTCSK